MATLQISEAELPSLPVKTAVVTGGSSGIGWATVCLLERKGAYVHILDVVEPEAELTSRSQLVFHRCDVSCWDELAQALADIPQIDMLFVNAGVPEPPAFFDEVYQDSDQQILKAPSLRVVDINLKGALYTTQLGWHHMKRHRRPGSIVITSSATAYFPWNTLALYSSLKLALVGIVRSLRSQTIRDDVTINAIAPGATVTKSLPWELAQPIQDSGMPISSADTVALAALHAATAQETRPVELYGGFDRETGNTRWNGRVTVTLGDRFWEVEEAHHVQRAAWLGSELVESFTTQQSVTDSR